MKTAVIILLLTLSGCAQCGRRINLETTGWSEVCINGVAYYQFQSGAFVAYNPDGTLRKCGG